MDQIVNKFLFEGDKFMPEMHLRQPGFTYSACGRFTKHKKRIQNFMQTGYINYIYKNELDKAHDAHVLLMMQHILIVKIWLKEHNQVKS